MKEKNVISVVEKFGFVNGRTTTTGETFQVGYWDFPYENKLGERLVIEVNCCYNVKSQHALPVLWYKNGWTDHLILNYIDVRPYVYNEDGECYDRYSFTKTSEDGKRRVIDFDWVLDANEANLAKLLTELLKRFNAGK
jgi:hypothetical protein